jgi:hypothetical protein
MGMGARRLRFAAMIPPLSFWFRMSNWMISSFAEVIYRVHEPSSGLALTYCFQQFRRQSLIIESRVVRFLSRGRLRHASLQ